VPSSVFRVLRGPFLRSLCYLLFKPVCLLCFVSFCYRSRSLLIDQIVGLAMSTNPQFAFCNLQFADLRLPRSFGVSCFSWSLPLLPHVQFLRLFVSFVSFCSKSASRQIPQFAICNLHFAIGRFATSTLLRCFVFFVVPSSVPSATSCSGLFACYASFPFVTFSAHCSRVWRAAVAGRSSVRQNSCGRKAAQWRDWHCLKSSSELRS